MANNDETNVADIFEVFKIARTPLEQLRAIPLQTLQKKFTIVMPITSYDLLQKGHIALATTPAPGHVVVDQAKFKEMFQEKAKEAALQSSTALLNQTDAAIENLKNNFEEELRLIIKMVQETMRSSQESTADSVRQVMSDFTKSEEEKALAVDVVLSKQNEALERFLTLLAEKEFTTGSQVREIKLDENEKK